VLTDTVGMALLVVLETLSPAERLSFVLHDVFAVPFDDVARIMDRTRTRPGSWPAGRAAECRRPRSPTVTSPATPRGRCLPGRGPGRRLRRAAARARPRRGLPDRPRPGQPARPPADRRAGAVASHVLATAPRFAHLAQPILVNGEAGALFDSRDKPIAVIGFTIANGRIAALNLIADTAKLRHLTSSPEPVTFAARRSSW
jgi:RNA polymerase sigma-70 factor, ECF subfamily